MNKTVADSSGSANNKTFRCPNCGGPIEYDIRARGFFCVSCKSPYAVQTKGTVEEYSFDNYQIREHRSGGAVTGVAQFRCESCGGEVYFSEHETAKRCPMCGSASVRPTVATSGIAPEGIVPFRIDSYDAQQRFRQWIQKRWFAPNLLKKAYAEGVLVGLYVPFWTYDAQANAAYSGQGGRTRTYRDRDGETRTRTDWFPVSGVVYRNFDDVLVCASRNQSGTVIQRVAPFNTISDINPFAVEYLSGYLAERYSIDGNTGFQTARSIMENQLSSDAHADILSRGFSQARVHSLRPAYRGVTYKSVLLPMYTAQYRYRDKLYNYAVNGQSGRVSGSYPKSPFKIAALVAVILMLLAALYFYGSQSDTAASYIPAASSSYTVRVGEESHTADIADYTDFVEDGSIPGLPRTQASNREGD